MQGIGSRQWILVAALPLVLANPAAAIQFTSLALSEDGLRAYLGTNDGFVTRVLLPSGIATGRVRVGSGRTLVVTDPDADRVHAIAQRSCGLVTLGEPTLEIQTTMPSVIGAPTHLLRSPTGSLVTIDSDYLGFFDADGEREPALQHRRFGWTFAQFVDTFLLVAEGNTVTAYDTRTGATRARITAPERTFAPEQPLAGDVGFVAIGRKLLAVDARLDVVASYTIPSETRPLVVSPDASLIFFGSASCWGPGCGSRIGTVSALDTASGLKLASIDLPLQADALALSPDGSELIAVHRYEQLLTVLKTSDLSIAATIDIPLQPNDLYRDLQVVFTPDGELYAMTGEALFSLSQATRTVVQVIDPRKAVESVSTSDAPDLEQIAESVARQRAYAAHIDGRISVVDGVDVTGEYDFSDLLEGEAHSIDASHDGRRLLAYATYGYPERHSKVLLIDANNLTVDAVVELDGAVRAAVFAADDATVYLAVWPSDELVAIDAASGAEIARKAVDDVTGMTVDAKGWLYLMGTDQVATLTVVDPVTLQTKRTVDLYGTRARVALAAVADGLYVGLQSGAAYDVPRIGFVDSADLDIVAQSIVPESVSRFIPDGTGRTYLEGSACWTHVEREVGGALHMVTRPVGGSATRLAVGAEASIVYSVPGTLDAIVLRDADTGERLARIPVAGDVSALVVRDRPGLPPRSTHTPTATSTPSPAATSTPSPSPTAPPALLRISATSTLSGEDVAIQVVLETRGNEVAGVQNAILFDGSSLEPLGCTVNPSLEKDLTAFRIDDGEIVAIVAGFNAEPIADGAALYTCRFRVGEDVPHGPQLLRIANAIASSTTGEKLRLTTADGAIDVLQNANSAPRSQPVSPSDPPATAAGCTLVPPTKTGGRGWLAFLAWLPTLALASRGWRSRRIVSG